MIRSTFSDRVVMPETKTFTPALTVNIKGSGGFEIFANLISVEADSAYDGLVGTGYFSADGESFTVAIESDVNLLNLNPSSGLPLPRITGQAVHSRSRSEDFSTLSTHLEIRITNTAASA